MTVLAPTKAVLGARPAGDLTVAGGPLPVLPHVPSLTFYRDVALLTGAILLLSAVAADHALALWLPGPVAIEPGLRWIAAAGLVLLTVGMSVAVG